VLRARRTRRPYTRPPVPTARTASSRGRASWRPNTATASCRRTR